MRSRVTKANIRRFEFQVTTSSEEFVFSVGFCLLARLRKKPLIGFSQNSVEKRHIGQDSGGNPNHVTLRLEGWG